MKDAFWIKEVLRGSSDDTWLVRGRVYADEVRVGDILFVLDPNQPESQNRIPFKVIDILAYDVQVVSLAQTWTSQLTIQGKQGELLSPEAVLKMEDGS